VELEITECRTIEDLKHNIASLQPTNNVIE
jgi:hypothetical protein